MKQGHENGGAPAGEAWVQALCVWCGAVEFALADLQLHVANGDQGLLEFACPSCDRLNARRLGRPELDALTKLGAAPTPGPAPFELLEEHSGPPITWDELIDFHEAVARLDLDHRPAFEDRPDLDPAEERDAA